MGGNEIFRGRPHRPDGPGRAGAGGGGRGRDDERKKEGAARAAPSDIFGCPLLFQPVEDPSEAPPVELHRFVEAVLVEGLVLPKLLGGRQVGQIEKKVAADPLFPVV